MKLEECCYKEKFESEYPAGKLLSQILSDVEIDRTMPFKADKYNLANKD
ncbi:hypothetical protein [Clostridium kluyveri]|nr:hypothetical protein [Clostridium kluyveri]UZQ49547.1 hypothetical protein OP486_16565 [Clostridium kluyveri]